MAWLGVLAVLAYAYGLGAASVIVWRHYRGSLWGYVPGVATAIYYVVAVFIAHPPAYRAALEGVAYPPGDVLRNWASTVAFGSSLLLISRLLRRPPDGG